MVPFWGRCTTHFRTYFSGDWDVHCGYDMDFDPWPYMYKMCFGHHGIVFPSLKGLGCQRHSVTEELLRRFFSFGTPVVIAAEEGERASGGGEDVPAVDFEGWILHW